MGNQLASEWANVSGAPLLFLGAVIFASVLIWAFVHFIYQARIERLRQDVSSEQAEVNRLRAKFSEEPASHRTSPGIQLGQVLPRPAPESAGPTPARAAEAQAAPPERSISDSRKALTRLDNVGYTAEMALQDASPAGMSAAVSKVQSGLLSIAKAFEIQVPNLDIAVNAKRALSAAAHYHKVIAPFLSDGHLEEARHRAAYICSMLESFMKGERTQPLDNR